MKEKGDKGFIWIPMLLFIGIFIMLIVFRTEASRMFWVRDKYVTAVDAASLAGASTAQVIPQDVTYSVIDSGGEPSIVETVGSWNTTVDKTTADSEGLIVVRLNVSDVDGHWQSTANQDVYTFTLYGMRFKSNLERLLGREIYLFATGDAKAIPKP